MEYLSGLYELTGFGSITWQMLVMWCVEVGMFYLAVFKKFEPLLLVPIAFGALIANLPTKGVIETPPVALHSEVDGVVTGVLISKGNEIIEQQALFQIPLLRTASITSRPTMIKMNGTCPLLKKANRTFAVTFPMARAPNAP